MPQGVHFQHDVNYRRGGSAAAGEVNEVNESELRSLRPAPVTWSTLALCICPARKKTTKKGQVTLRNGEERGAWGSPNRGA